MKPPLKFLALFALLGALILSACGGAVSESVSTREAERQGVYEPQAESAPMAKGAPPAADAFALPGESLAPAAPVPNVVMPTALPPAGESASGEAAVGAGRMVIKNAEIKLQVEDTDIALNLATQAIGDVGGYIVSSRVWYQPHYDGKNYKYASVTIGVPAAEFERMLNKLRGIASQVLDETATGEDVSDQFVDLQSQVQNLEATRDRIKSFLDQAKTVDEALRINQELSNVEAQIEQLKGRMNYLQDRAAYSTITAVFEPKLPELPTPTPVPSATPKAWNPGETAKEASQTLAAAYQGIVTLLIWLGIVVLPLVAPPFFVLWLLWRWLRKAAK